MNANLYCISVPNWSLPMSIAYYALLSDLCLFFNEGEDNRKIISKCAGAEHVSDGLCSPIKFTQ